jgi:hypothetical protein
MASRTTEAKSLRVENIFNGSDLAQVVAFFGAPSLPVAQDESLLCYIPLKRPNLTQNTTRSGTRCNLIIAANWQ